MLTDFKIPEVGENITSGTAVRINVTVGQAVKKDQSLLEMETDKATIEVPSSVAGVIKEILIKEGSKIKVGEVVMRIEAGASAGPATTPQPANPPKAAAVAPKVSQPTEKTSLAPQPPTALVQTAAVTVDVPAAPSVRRLARELGVNVAEVSGSGPGGRISKEDVKAYAKRLITAGPVSLNAVTTANIPLPDFSKYGAIERKPMNNIRKKTAEHLSFAWNTIPHVTQFDKADITELEKLRKKFSKPERRLSITPFLMKVTAAALKLFPQFNSSVDMATGEIIYKNYFHIGVAVDTPNGLVVPVIRDVDQKTILQLSTELTQVADRAREKKITIDEMRGGTFTISNLGGIGGTGFTPIVNWPEVAILGVARGRMEPNYDKTNHCMPALMLPLSLSYDHRVIDGAAGAKFLRWIAEAIEQPFLMELDGK